MISITRQFLFNVAFRPTLLFSGKSLRFATNQAKTQKDEDHQTHFGFETVKPNERAKKVHKIFEDIANNYDLTNDVMSLGMHRMWRDTFIDRLRPLRGIKHLDMAAGTGLIAFRILDVLKNEKDFKHSEVTICDINQHMLDVGKIRAIKQGYVEEKLQDIKINWVCADAEKLPFGDHTFNSYTIAFGIRCCTHIDKVLAEAFRVLRKGGRFMCLEFSHLENSTLQWLYDQYSFQMIPLLGQIITGQMDPYKFLVGSIRKFPKQEDFKQMIEEAGFNFVSYENLNFGIVSIHSGFKL